MRESTSQLQQSTIEAMKSEIQTINDYEIKTLHVFLDKSVQRLNYLEQELEKHKKYLPEEKSHKLERRK